MSEQANITYPGAPSAEKTKGKAQAIDLLIGQQIRKFRKLRRMTQNDLAEKLGLSFQQIQKYENGKNRISFSQIHDLSKHLGVPVQNFLGDQATGMADSSAQADLSGHPASNFNVSQKEMDELLAVYCSIEDPALRKNFLSLAKSMAENLKNS